MSSDYSAQLNSIAASLKVIAETNIEILNRMSNKKLGVYMQQAESSESALTRAVLVNALQQSGQLEDVASEMITPTPVP